MIIGQCWKNVHIIYKCACVIYICALNIRKNRWINERLWLSQSSMIGSCQMNYYNIKKKKKKKILKYKDMRKLKF